MAISPDRPRQPAARRSGSESGRGRDSFLIRGTSTGLESIYREERSSAGSRSMQMGAKKLNLWPPEACWRPSNFTSAAFFFTGNEHVEHVFIGHLRELLGFLNTRASKQVKSEQYFP